MPRALRFASRRRKTLKHRFVLFITVLLVLAVPVAASSRDISRNLEVYLKRNKAILPSASLIFHEEGNIKRGHTELPLDPRSAKNVVAFKTDIGPKELFQSVVWQVSRTPFPDDAYSDSPLSPPNMIADGLSSTSVFKIDFHQVMNQLSTRSGNVTYRSPSAALANGAGVSSAPRAVANRSPFILGPIHQQRKGDGFAIYSDVMTLDVPVLLYVRAVPVASAKGKDSPTVIGRPSSSLRIAWGENARNALDMSTFQISKNISYDLDLVGFQFVPYKYTHNWPSGCKEPPRDRGKSFPENVIDTVADGYNWASATYDRMIYYVSVFYNVMENLAGLVSLETAAVVFDQTLSEVGIPPNLHNAYEMYAAGADYLAIQAVDKIPEPGPGDYGDQFLKESQLTWDEMRYELKSDFRELTEDVVRKMAQKQAEDVEFCRGRVESPYLLLRIRNSSRQDYQHLSFELTDSKQLFMPIAIPLSSIAAGETVTIPVFYLDQPRLEIAQRSQLLGWDNRAALNDWWDEFPSTKFRFELTGPKRLRCYRRKQSCETSKRSLYESPRRSWFKGKAFSYAR